MRTSFRDILDLNDKYNLYDFNSDPKYVHYNKSPLQFEQDKSGNSWDFVIAEADFFKRNFPDVPIRAFLISAWIGALHYYTHAILTFQHPGEDGMAPVWWLFESAVKNKGGLKFGVYGPYVSPEQIISHEQYVISHNPVNSDQHLHQCTFYTYEFNPLDPKFIGLNESQTIEYMKRLPLFGIFPSKDMPVGKPSRNKSVRRQDETKIQRYNKYNLTQRSYDVVYEDELDAPDVVSSPVNSGLNIQGGSGLFSYVGDKWQGGR